MAPTKRRDARCGEGKKENEFSFRGFEFGCQMDKTLTTEVRGEGQRHGQTGHHGSGFGIIDGCEPPGMALGSELGSSERTQ